MKILFVSVSHTDDCVKFLQEQAKNLNLPIRIYYPADPKKPVVVISWEGLQPELPSIVLNSHMDVVPAFEKYWTHPPFAAEIDEEGRIFARGAQDTKSIATQYLAAIRALKREGVQLKRTVHVMFVPDEETDTYGMEAFVPTDDFRALNVAFLLDEGVASPTDVYLALYAERGMWCKFESRNWISREYFLVQRDIVCIHFVLSFERSTF